MSDVLLGTQIRVKLVDLRDATGTIASSATASCVVTKPDASTTSLGSATNDTGGAYHWDYTTVAAGVHWATITVSSPFALVEQVRFVVGTPEPA